MVIFHCYVSSPEGKGEWFFKSILQILWDLGSRRDIQIFQTSWPRFRGDCSWLQVTLILHCKILDPWKDMRRIATYYAILYIAVEHCSCMFKSNPARWWSTLPLRAVAIHWGEAQGRDLSSSRSSKEAMAFLVDLVGYVPTCAQSSRKTIWNGPDMFWSLLIDTS